MSDGMPCPKCNHNQNRVTDSRMHESVRRRRRICMACSYRFNTFEITSLEDMAVVLAPSVASIVVQRIQGAVNDLLMSNPDEVAAEALKQVIKLMKPKEN